MSIRNIDDQKNELLKKIESITTSDTISQFMEKCNNNFSEIAKYGGGPAGKTGEQGSQGNPTKPKVPIHVWKKGEEYSDEREINSTKTYEIIDINEDLYNSKYQEGHLIMLENAHAYILKNYDQQLKPEFVAAISSLNTKDLEEALAGIYGYVHIAYAKDIDKNGEGWNGFITDQQLSNNNPNEEVIIGGNIEQEFKEKDDKYEIFYLSDYKYMGIYSDNQKISVSNPEKYTWFNIQKDIFEASLSNSVTTVLVNHNYECIESTTLTTSVNFYKNSEIISKFNVNIELDKNDPNFNNFTIVGNKVSCNNIVFSNGGDVKVPIKITYTNPIDESENVTKIYWTLSPIKVLEDVKIFIDKNVVNISNHTKHVFKIGYYIFTNGQTKFVDSPINNLKGYKWYFINDYDNGLNKIIENIKSYPSLNVDSWNDITHDFAPNSNINSNIYKYCYVLLCDENYNLIDCDVITTVDNGNDIHLELSKPYIVLPANIEGNGVHGSYDDDINPITTKITLYDNGDIISNNIEYEFYNHYIDNNYNVIDELIFGTDDNGKENISVDKDGVITISKDYLKVGIQKGHKEIKCVVKYNHIDRNNGDSDIEYNATIEKILTIELKETPYKLEFDKNKLKRDKDNNYDIIGDTLNCNVKCYINGSWQNDNTYSVKATWVDNNKKNVDFNFDENSDSDSDIDYGYTLDLSNLNKNNNYKDINYIVISYYNDKEPYLTETICILDDGDKGNDIYLELSKPYIVLPANIDGNGVHEYYDEEKYPITSKITLYDNGTPITEGVTYIFYDGNDIIDDDDISVDSNVVIISKNYLNEVGIQKGHKEIKCEAIYTYHDNDTSTDKEVKIEKILTIELKETPYKLEFDKNTLKRKLNKVDEYVYDLEIIGNTLNCNVKCYINGLWKNDNTFSVIATCMDDDSDDNNNYSYTFDKNTDSDRDYDYTLYLNNLNKDYGDSELSDIDNIVISCYKGDTTYLTETIWILDDGPEGKRGISGEKGDDIYLDLSKPYIVLPANINGTGIHELYDNEENPKHITSKIVLYKNGVSFKEDEYSCEFFDEENNPIDDDDISVDSNVVIISKDYLNRVGIKNGHKEIRCVVNVDNIYDPTDIDGVISYEKILTIGLNETPYKLELSEIYTDSDTPKIGNTIKYSEKLSELQCKIKTYINGRWEDVTNNSYKNSYTIQFTINDDDDEKEIRFDYDSGYYYLVIKENNDLLELLSNINKFNLDLISKDKVKLLTEEICLLYDADYTCLELSKQHITLPTNIDGTGIHELYIDNEEDTNIPLLTFKIYDSINYDLPNNYKIECFYEGIEPSIKLTDSNDNDNYLSCNPSGKDINVTTTKSKFNKLLDTLLLNVKNFNIKDIFEIKIVATPHGDDKTYESYFYIEFKETPYKLEFNQNILRRDNEDEDYIVRENPLNCNVKCYINGSWQNDNTYSVKATWNNHFYNFYKNDDSDRDYDYTLDLSEDEISLNLNGDDNKDIDNIVISCYDGEKTYLTEKILILDPGIQGIQGIPGPNMYLDISKSHFVLPANIDGNGVHAEYNKDITSKVTLYKDGTIFTFNSSEYNFYDGNSKITEGIKVNNGVITITKDYLNKVDIQNGYKEIRCEAIYTYETNKNVTFEKILTFELKETPYKLEFDKNTLKRDKYNENKVIGDTLKCNVICYIDGEWVNDNSTFSVISSLAKNGTPDFAKNSDSDSDYDYTLNLSNLEFNGVDNIVISCYKGDTTYLTETIWILDDGKYGKSISLDLSKSHFILPANIDGNGIHDEYKEPITSKITLYDDCTPIADGVEYKFYEYNTENSDWESDPITSGVSVENGVITIEKNYLNNNSNSKFENGHKEIKCVVKYTYNNDTSEDKEITFEKILTFELKETPYKLEFDKTTLKRKLIESDESDEFDDSNKYVIIDGELNCNVICYINGKWVKDNKYDIIVPSDDISDDDINIEKNETGNYGYTLNLSKLGGDNYKDLDNIVISYHNNNTNTTYLTETIWILDDGKDGHSIYLELSKPYIVLPANLEGNGVHELYDEAITSKVTLYDNGTSISDGVTYEFYDENGNITEYINVNNGEITITDYLYEFGIQNGHKEIRCVVYYNIQGDSDVTNDLSFEKILTIELKETPYKLEFEFDKNTLKRKNGSLIENELNFNVKCYINGSWINDNECVISTSADIDIEKNYILYDYTLNLSNIKGDKDLNNIVIFCKKGDTTYLTETIWILDDGVDGEKGKDGQGIYFDIHNDRILLPTNIFNDGILESENFSYENENIIIYLSLFDLSGSGNQFVNYDNIEYKFTINGNDKEFFKLSGGINNTYILTYKNTEVFSFEKPSSTNKGIGFLKVLEGFTTIFNDIYNNNQIINGRMTILCEIKNGNTFHFKKCIYFELKETPFKLELNKNILKINELPGFKLTCKIKYNYKGIWKDWIKPIEENDILLKVFYNNDSDLYLDYVENGNYYVQNFDLPITGVNNNEIKIALYKNKISYEDILSETIKVFEDVDSSSLTTNNNRIIIKDNDIILNNEHNNAVAIFSSESNENPDSDFYNDTLTKIDSNGIVVSYINKNIFEATNDKISMIVGNNGIEISEDGIVGGRKNTYDLIVDDNFLKYIISNSGNDNFDYIYTITYNNKVYNINHEDNVSDNDNIQITTYGNIYEENITCHPPYASVSQSSNHFYHAIKIDNKEHKIKIYYSPKYILKINFDGYDNIINSILESIEVQYNNKIYKNDDTILLYYGDNVEKLSCNQNIIYIDDHYYKGIFDISDIDPINIYHIIPTIKLTYYKGYYYNFKIITSPSIADIDKYEGVINGFVINNNSNIFILDKDINDYIFNAKVKITNTENIYDNNNIKNILKYLFYVDDEKNVILEIYQAHEKNVKTITFEGVYMDSEPIDDDVPLCIYGHILKRGDKIKLFEGEENFYIPDEYKNINDSYIPIIEYDENNNVRINYIENVYTITFVLPDIDDFDQSDINIPIDDLDLYIKIGDSYYNSEISYPILTNIDIKSLKVYIKNEYEEFTEFTDELYEYEITNEEREIIIKFILNYTIDVTTSENLNDKIDKNNYRFRLTNGNDSKYLQNGDIINKNDLTTFINEYQNKFIEKDVFCYIENDNNNINVNLLGLVSNEIRIKLNDGKNDYYFRTSLHSLKESNILDNLDNCRIQAFYKDNNLTEQIFSDEDYNIYLIDGKSTSYDFFLHNEPNIFGFEHNNIFEYEYDNDESENEHIIYVEYVPNKDWVGKYNITYQGSFTSSRTNTIIISLDEKYNKLYISYIDGYGLKKPVQTKIYLCIDTYYLKERRLIIDNNYIDESSHFDKFNISYTGSGYNIDINNFAIRDENDPENLKISMIQVDKISS